MKDRKKTMVIAAGSLIAAGAIASSCVPSTVYGPPQETPNPVPTFQAEVNIPVTVYGPPPEELNPAFSPDDNVPEEVYGPPMPFEEESDTADDFAAEEQEKASEHEDN